MPINILAIGDVSGAVGLEFLKKHLSSFQQMKNIAFTVVNGENTNVIGITPKQADEIFAAGADVITLGNHTWIRTEMQDYLDANGDILRPLNYASQCPGNGWGVYERDFGDICVINLMGRYSMDSNTDNPFAVVDGLMGHIDAKIILVDMHAEVTSERMAMGYFLDGRASAVWGTHTHVQTSDAMVLPGGTGYISDLGMTGPIHSILGIRAEQSIARFLGDPHRRYDPAPGPAKMECCIFEIDEESGRCLNVEALRIT